MQRTSREIETANRFVELLDLSENAADKVRARYDALKLQVRRQGVYRKVREDTGITKREAEIFAIKHGIKFDKQNILMYAKTSQKRDNGHITAQWLQHPNWDWKHDEILAIIENALIAIAMVYEYELALYKAVLIEVTERAYEEKLQEISEYLGIEADGKLTDEKIEKIINRRWYGANYRERIERNMKRLQSNITKSVVSSFISGLSEDEEWEEVGEIIEDAIRNSRLLIRTETSLAANTADLEAYHRMGIEKYRYCAILDERTSIMCAEMDGSIIPVKDAVIGVNYPPLHPWCRSFTIPERSKNE